MDGFRAGRGRIREGFRVGCFSGLSGVLSRASCGGSGGGGSSDYSDYSRGEQHAAARTEGVQNEVSETGKRYGFALSLSKCAGYGFEHLVASRRTLASLM